MQNGHKAITATLTHTVTDKLIYTLQRRHMATAGHAPTKSVRPREDERLTEGGNEAKAAQIISHHLSVKIRILNKRATRNYHGPGIKAAPTDQETPKRPRDRGSPERPGETGVSAGIWESGAGRDCSRS